MLLSHRTSTPLRSNSPRSGTLLLVWVLLLCASAARAQDSTGRGKPVEFGVVGEFGGGVQNGSFAIYPGFDGCGLFNGATVLRGGAGGVVRLPQLLGENWGVAALGLWDQSRARYTARPIDAQRIVDEQSGAIVELDREFRFTSITTSVRLELAAMVRLAEGLHLSLGPSLGVVLKASDSQSDNVLGPGDRSFANGENSRPMEHGFTPDAKALTLGATARLTYQLPFTVMGRLTPIVGAVVGGDLLGAESERGWRAIHGGGMFGFLYTIVRSPDTAETLPPTDTARRDTLPTPAPPVATLLFTGVDDNDRPSTDAVVVVTTVVRRRFTPMLPLVYFDSGASAPAARYTRITADSARRFAILPLARLGPFDLSHHILDLVGWRWNERKRPAKVLLYGAASEGEPSALARARARWVADYLTSVWRIPRKLVEVRTEPAPFPLSAQQNADGQAENRRVAIASDDPDLLGPLEVEQAVRDFNPPRIRLEPRIEAEAGVRNWTIVLRQRDVELARFALRDSSAGSRTWRLLDGSIDSALNVLEAELVAEDSLGRTARADARLVLRTRRDTGVVESRRAQLGERERLEWGLVGFGFREAEGTERHVAELTDLAALAGDTVLLDAAGTTDRVGDEENNRLLSQRRAEWAVSRLRALLAGRGVTVLEGNVRGLGVDATRFPNEYPEGRVLSRGVTVGIEQEVGSGER